MNDVAQPVSQAWVVGRPGRVAAILWQQEVPRAKISPTQNGLFYLWTENQIQLQLNKQADDHHA